MSHNEGASSNFFIVGKPKIMSERHHVLLAAALFLTCLGNAACSAAGSPTSALDDHATRRGGGPNGSGTGGTGAIIDPNQGGTGMRDPNDTRDVPVRKKMC